MADRFTRETRFDEKDATEGPSFAEKMQNIALGLNLTTITDADCDDISTGTTCEAITALFPKPPPIKDMIDDVHKNITFMIESFKYDISEPNREPSRKQNGANHRWDDYHVHMPSSCFHVNKRNERRWDEVQSALLALQNKCLQGCAFSENISETINICAGQPVNIENLHAIIQNVYTPAESAHFMSKVLPNICAMAINADTICGQTPPLLLSGSNGSITMSQRQAASLLACGFFCMFPGRSNRPHGRPGSSFPDPNFHRLYINDRPSKIEKLKCLLHYFTRVTNNMPNGVITFRRFVLDPAHYPIWETSQKRLSELVVIADKKIEDIGGVLQVDFANKYIGGGVLGSGCVQEEIRFTICPEMLVSLLLCEKMHQNECIFLIGCERYSEYDGYADSFKFAGNFDDKTLKDDWGRKWCHLVAMDAIFFRKPETQFHMDNIDRELIKAYTSFLPTDETGLANRHGIATGNWGCGAFHGDKQLKSMIQLLAGSEAERPLIYAAYGDRRFAKSLKLLYNHLKEQEATVGDLYKYLRKYSLDRCRKPLFDMIRETPLSTIRAS